MVVVGFIFYCKRLIQNNHDKRIQYEYVIVINCNEIPYLLIQLIMLMNAHQNSLEIGTLGLLPCDQDSVMVLRYSIRLRL